MKTNALGVRLRQARKEQGLTLERVSELVGVRLNTIWRHEKGEVHPSEPVLKLCAMIYEKPLEWFFREDDGTEVHPKAKPLESATSPPSPSGGVATLDGLARTFSARFDRLETYIRAQAPVQAIGESRTDYDPSNYDPTDRRPVELLEVASAAGVGAEVYDETPIGLLWFRNDWLLSHSIDPEQSNIISVRGESMEPTLPDGCSILVDRKRREPQDGRIYVMRTEEGLVVKRLGLDEEGRWEIRSDSPDWRATPMSPEAEIVGEVRWSAVTY